MINEQYVKQDIQALLTVTELLILQESCFIVHRTPHVVKAVCLTDWKRKFTFTFVLQC